MKTTWIELGDYRIRCEIYQCYRETDSPILLDTAHSVTNINSQYFTYGNTAIYQPQPKNLLPCPKKQTDQPR